MSHRLADQRRYQVPGVAIALLTLILGSASAAVTTAQATPADYDVTVLGDHPLAFWTLDGTSTDVTGNGHGGVYKGGIPAKAQLPNGETASEFDGASQYFTVPSSAAFSIPSTGQLTWEGWIRPATLQFRNSTDGYVDWMGKCQDYGPTCEWEARMYDQSNPEGRSSRISAYVFNSSAGLGSAADWQPAAAQIGANRWIHVVGEYQTAVTPPDCSSRFPGTINIWVDGVKQSFADHAPTGCMSQYSIVPRAGTSPVNIGTMALDSWFEGAIGKVAIYGTLLSQGQIDAHFAAMTGRQPAGSCADACVLISAPSTPPSSVSAAPDPSAIAIPGPSDSGSPATTEVPSPSAVSTSPAPSVSLTTSAGTPRPVGAVNRTGVSARWSVTQTWPTGYCASVTVTNRGVGRRSWSTTLVVPGRVTSVWNATWAQTAQALTLRNAAWNGVLAPYQSLSGIGFCSSTKTG